MPLLSNESLMEKAAKRASYRLKTAGTKLNTVELAALEKHCRDKGVTPGELIRQLILAELAQDQNEKLSGDPTLIEIVGVRLLLVNVLRPLAAGQKVPVETFDKLLDQISTAKHELAAELAMEKGK
ncbi:MAG TPA: hypothetical protein VME86_11350 [Acidobacteriaceae bacterium]|nr:hypothetical protein [Acidobacteriaceae bacterium]